MDGSGDGSGEGSGDGSGEGSGPSMNPEPLYAALDAGKGHRYEGFEKE